MIFSSPNLVACCNELEYLSNASEPIEPNCKANFTTLFSCSANALIFLVVAAVTKPNPKEASNNLERNVANELLSNLFLVVMSVIPLPTFFWLRLNVLFAPSTPYLANIAFFNSWFSLFLSFVALFNSKALARLASLPLIVSFVSRRCHLNLRIPPGEPGILKPFALNKQSRTSF